MIIMVIRVIIIIIIVTVIVIAVILNIFLFLSETLVIMPFEYKLPFSRDICICMFSLLYIL